VCICDVYCVNASLRGQFVCLISESAYVMCACVLYECASAYVMCACDVCICICDVCMCDVCICDVCTCDVRICIV
jgi:hypothetical protein